MENSHSYAVPAPGEMALPLSPSPEIGSPRKTVVPKEGTKNKYLERFKLLNRFVDSGMRDLKPSEGCVWLALFRNAAADGTVTMSRSRIVELTGRDDKTITAALTSLIAAGWLRKVRKGSPLVGASIYRLTTYPMGGKSGVETGERTGLYTDSS